MHAGKVADAAGNGHETLVLDGPGLCADPHARVSVLRVGEERHEEDLHALVGHDARQLGELDVVADQHADAGAVRVEGLHHAAAAQTPALHLVGRDVHLLVHVVGAVAAAEEADVVEPSVGLDVGHAAGDDVDVVADGQLDEAVADLLGVLCQPADRLCFAQVVEAGHERGVEVLGEEHEVALVVRDGIDEELDLLEDVVEGLVGTHLPLHEAHADGGLLVHELLCRGLVVDVVPLQERGAVARLLVVGQVVGHDAPHVEVVRELEGQHRVVDLARADAVDVLLGTHPVGVLVVVGDAAAEHDRLEVELLAELLAVVVHASGQAQAAVVGVDEYLDAVEDVALGVVGREGLVAGDLCVGVVALDHVVIDDDREGAAHDPLADDRDDLPLGEDVDQFVDLLAGPEYVLVRIDAREGLCQLPVVLHLEVADLDPVDLVHVCHMP